MFTPAQDWTGTVTFTYTITDKGTGLNASAVAHITISEQPPPVAVDDVYVLVYNKPYSLLAPGILENDFSPSKGVLKVTNQPVPSEGNLTVEVDGSLTYMPPDGFSGNVTFTYTISDGVSKDTDTALVTLIIPKPATLIAPSNYTFQTPYQTPTDSDKTSNLLADIQPDDPKRPVKLVVKGLLKAPAPTEGNVTVKPDGTYTFVPAPGFSGGCLCGGTKVCCLKKHSAGNKLQLPVPQPVCNDSLKSTCLLTEALPPSLSAPGTTEFCVNVADELSGGEARVCVKIVVPPKEPVVLVIPLEPTASGSPAECPDAAHMAQIAADYAGVIKTQAGVVDVIVDSTKCTWIVSGARGGARPEARAGWRAWRARGCCHRAVAVPACASEQGTRTCHRLRRAAPSPSPWCLLPPLRAPRRFSSG